MNRTITRRITAAIAAAIAAPVAAAGIFLGSMTLGTAASALAEPTTSTECSSMAMPATQAGTTNPNPLTRAGQIAAARNPATPGGAMDMGCPVVGHG